MRKISHLFAMAAALISCCFVACEKGEEIDNPIPEVAQITVSLVSPADEAVGVSDTPSFEWSSEIKPADLVGVIYDVYVGENKDNMKAVEIDCVDQKFTMTSGLSMGSTYYWKVVAYGDNTEFSSEVNSFTVRTLEAPVATAPADGTTMKGKATFEWEQIAASGDESYTYTVWAVEDGNAMAEEFAVGSVEDAGELTMSDEAYAKFAFETTYKWWVTVTLGKNVAQSNALTFYNIDANTPSTPKILTPETSKSFESNENITFTWEAATDPNGDDLTYTIKYTVNGGEEKTLVENTSETSYVGDVFWEESAISEYSWWVIASDDNGHSSESAVSNFYVESKVTLNAVGNGSTLGLGEAITWSEAKGAKYTVYLNGAVIASGLDTPSYKIPNSKMSCTLVTGAKTFTAYVKAVNGSITLTSNTISFKPAMKGTITDVRGDESITYDWVRIGPRVWLADNLKATRFTDGTSIPYSNSGALDPNDTNVAQGDANKKEAYYNTQLFGYDHSHQSFWTNDTQQNNDVAKMVWQNWDEETYNEKTGNVYSYWTAANEKLAPEGWHTATHAEWSNLLSASDQVGLSSSTMNGLGSNCTLGEAKKIIHTDYQGATNTLGLGLTPTATRAANAKEFGGVVPPYRNGLWQYQGTYWMIHEEYLGYYLDGTFDWAHYAEMKTERLPYRLSLGYVGNNNWSLCRNTWSIGYYFAVRCVYNDDQN